VRPKLPALVDEVVIIGTIITNKVTVLVGGVIDTGNAVSKGLLADLESFATKAPSA
jgi:hypothetical protein